MELSKNYLVAFADKVTVETKDDALAVLFAYHEGCLTHPDNVPRGKITDYRKSLVVSGRVIVYVGHRYFDGFQWQRSTFSSDKDFQMYWQKDPSGSLDMRKLLIGFKHGSTVGKIVAYQAMHETHPNASSVFLMRAPEGAFQLILGAPGDDEDDDDDNSNEKTGTERMDIRALLNPC